eukprot:503701_1
MYASLNVSIENEAAINLYRKGGFIIEKTISSWYETTDGSAVDAYFMTKTANNPAAKKLKCEIILLTPSKLKSIYFQNYDTPVTKTALRALRCKDLKQKLKKHDIKVRVKKKKKKDLVNALFNYKNKNKIDTNIDSDDVNTKTKRFGWKRKQ